MGRLAKVNVAGMLRSHIRKCASEEGMLDVVGMNIYALDSTAEDVDEDSPSATLSVQEDEPTMYFGQRVHTRKWTVSLEAVHNDPQVLDDLQSILTALPTYQGRALEQEMGSSETEEARSFLMVGLSSNEGPVAMEAGAYAYSISTTLQLEHS